VEGFVVEKISSTSFLFCGIGRSCGNEVGRSLFQGKVRDYSLCNVLREAKYLS